MTNTEPPSDSPSDRLTIVVHLPQTLAKVAELLRTVGEEWPHVVVNGNRVEIPADE